MSDLIKDIQTLMNNMKNSQPDDAYYAYAKQRKNLIMTPFVTEKPLVEKRKSIINKQQIMEETLQNELLKFDAFNIPIIGLKGIFVKNEYYKTEPRMFNDLDLLVSSSDAYKLYEGLKSLGYQIKKKTLYDNPIINMKFIPKFYMENTQTLMLFNKKNNISIDIHSNLNITNAHFIHSNVRFNTAQLFKNSTLYKSYNNIRILETHDNLCFLFRHLLKHHMFYGKTQYGLHTTLQNIMDLAVIINSDKFDEGVLLERVKKYNIIPEAMFCLNLYNAIFVSGKKIDLTQYLKELSNIDFDFRWKPILLASFNMKAENIMIGNYYEYFPKLQKAINFSQKIPNFWVDWAIQAFLIGPAIKLLLK